jgi:hypothetical protein
MDCEKLQLHLERGLAGPVACVGGSGNPCEVQVRKAVWIRLFKNSRCRSDGDINAVLKGPGDGAVDWIHLA